MKLLPFATLIFLGIACEPKVTENDDTSSEAASEVSDPFEELFGNGGTKPKDDERYATHQPFGPSAAAIGLAP